MICLHKSDEKGEDDAKASTPTRITTTLINPAIKKQYEIEIMTLQTAPRIVGKLERIIKAKQKKREEDTTMHVEDMQDLVTENEMLKFVLFLVNSNFLFFFLTSGRRPLLTPSR